MTIAGSGFTGATAVSFGSTAATSFTVDSDTQITAVSPAGTAGAVDVTVTTPYGQSLPDGGGEFTYVAPGEVTGVTPSAGPTAGGTTVTLTGSGFTGATAVRFGTAAAASFTVDSDTKITAVSPPGAAGAVDVTVTTMSGSSPASPLDQFTYFGPPTVSALAPGSGPSRGGTEVLIQGADLDGTSAVDFGSSPAAHYEATSDVSLLATSPPGTGAVNVTVTRLGSQSPAAAGSQFVYQGGYWQVASDGGIFAFGSAQFYGSMGGRPLNKPVVGISGTPDGGGYWEVASDGGIFAFGDAQFYGSMGGKPLNQPVVGIAAMPTGQGYWEVASDGGVFAFGSAQFYGSMGGRPLNQPVVGIAAMPTGQGYWEVASDGGIFVFGSAQFYGSMGGKPLNQPIVGISGAPTGHGYWEVASDGGIFAFGSPSSTVRWAANR